ncbi:MAG: type II secretion system F family protein, partial [Planctomycetaceae bacterium]|nr:type II secretion system F family protein [Planctomycetaceae bacterium]
MFAPQMPLASLSMFCRSLGTMLDSGVPLLKALSVIGKQQRTDKARQILENVHDDLRKGSDLATALREHGTYFPEL